MLPSSIISDKYNPVLCGVFMQPTKEGPGKMTTYKGQISPPHIYYVYGGFNGLRIMSWLLKIQPLPLKVEFAKINKNSTAL